MGPSLVYLKRFRRMQAVVREHLHTRLPAQLGALHLHHAAEAPLNPNGKVDTPNLPFPDTAEMTEEASEEDLKSWKLCQRQRGPLPRSGRLSSRVSTLRLSSMYIDPEQWMLYRTKLTRF